MDLKNGIKILKTIKGLNIFYFLQFLCFTGLFFSFGQSIIFQGRYALRYIFYLTYAAFFFLLILLVLRSHLLLRRQDYRGIKLFSFVLTIYALFSLVAGLRQLYHYLFPPLFHLGSISTFFNVFLVYINFWGLLIRIISLSFFPLTLQFAILGFLQFCFSSLLLAVISHYREDIGAFLSSQKIKSSRGRE